MYPVLFGEAVANFFTTRIRVANVSLIRMIRCIIIKKIEFCPTIASFPAISSVHGRPLVFFFIALSESHHAPTLTLVAV